METVASCWLLTSLYPIKCACYINGEGRFNTFELYGHIYASQNTVTERK
jgi:hypothetical protein